MLNIVYPMDRDREPNGHVCSVPCDRVDIIRRPWTTPSQQHTAVYPYTISRLETQGGEIDMQMQRGGVRLVRWTSERGGHGPTSAHLLHIGN